MKVVRAVDYQRDYAYARGSVPALINLEYLTHAMLIPSEQTRNALEDITRLFFADGTYIDVFGRPEDFAQENNDENTN